jgi:hypothetical protein
MFTSSECFDMLVLNGQCDESATVAAQEYYGGQKILNDQILAYQEMSM